MKWTRDFPREEGYYWCHLSGGCGQRTTIGTAFSLRDGRFLYSDGINSGVPIVPGDDVWWGEQITLPESPTLDSPTST